MKRQISQEWECLVEEVTEDSVICELYDLTDSSNSSELAEIFLSHIPKQIVEKLEEGFAFYWQIGTTEDERNVDHFSNFFIYEDFLLNTDRERIEQMRLENNK